VDRLLPGFACGERWATYCGSVGIR
jgi:hypothetical protein